MKRKSKIIGLYALVALAACFVFLSRDGRGRATQAAKSRLVITPGGTIAIPQNDYVTFVAEAPITATNTSPTAKPPGQK